MRFKYLDLNIKIYARLKSLFVLRFVKHFRDASPFVPLMFKDKNKSTKINDDFLLCFRSDYQPCEDSGLLRSATFNGM